MRDPNNPCLFCNPKESGIAHENDLAYASYDTYPVSDHHCLIIPKSILSIISNYQMMRLLHAII
jgi:diadenosine tetraphosphate (Ap4A) HIT family hydrolase